MLRYVIDGMEANDKNLFLEKSNQYLATELRGEVMTLAQQFEQVGVVKGMEQGLQQGMKQGMQQGEYNLLLRQLRLKFHNIPEVYQQRLVHADAETLLIWGDRVLGAATLKDIFEE